MRARPNADVVKSCGKCLQVLQLNVEHMLILPFEECQQLFQVVLVGFEGVWRHVTFQFQVAHILLYDCLLLFHLVFTQWMQR